MSSKTIYKNANGIDAEVTLVNPDTNTRKRTVELNSIMDKTPTIATLRAKTEIPETIYVTGYHSEGDGAFGSHFFRWNSTSVEDDNGGTIIKLDSVATGRYELQYDGAVNVKWFGAKGDGITDDTVAIQNAINISENGITIPKGTYKANIYLKSNLTIHGAGMDSCIISPYIDDHVIKTLTTGKTEKVVIENLRIDGNLAFTNSDGVHLETSGVGNYIDTIRLTNVRIWNCGRDGLRAVGTAAVGPFVQRLYLDNCDLSWNQYVNFNVIGTVLETLVIHSTISEPRDITGNGYPVYFEYNGDYPLRCTFINTLFSNSTNKSSAMTAYGVFIKAVSNLSFIGCNFEFVDPAIYTESFVFAQGFVADNCNFSFSEDTTNVFWLKHSENTMIKNCTIKISTGYTITNVINLDGAMSSIYNVTHKNTLISGTYTEYLKDSTSFYQTVSSGTIRSYRDVVVVNGDGGADDNLDSILDIKGNGNGFYPGQTITLLPFNGTNITVKHGTGNILLNGAADYTMSGASNQNSITLVWDGTYRDKWREIGRT